VSLEEIQADKKNQQLRDSVSSMLSNDRSTVGSIYDTPGSSPASSVVITSFTSRLDPSTPPKKGKGTSRKRSSLPQPGRRTSMPPNSSQLPRKGISNRLSTQSVIERLSPSPSSRQGSATPTDSRAQRPSLISTTYHPDGRPRWNSSVNTKDTIIGHNFKPLSATTPSPHARAPSKPPSAHANRSDSKIPLRSPLSRDNTSSPNPETTPSRKSGSRLAFRDRISSPGPYSQQVLAASSPARPRHLASQSSLSALDSASHRRASLQPKNNDSALLSNPLPKPTRPASSFSSNRRTSLLPLPRGRQDSGSFGSSVTGRESPQAIAGAVSAMRNSSQTSLDSKGKEKERKPWR
jgi:hypothetical protein